MRCTVKGCFSDSGKGIKMHHYPADPQRRGVWERLVGRRDKDNPNRRWKANRNHRICSLHFEEHCYEQKRMDGLRKLRCDAVPRIFPNFYNRKSSRKQPHPRGRNPVPPPLLPPVVQNDHQYFSQSQMVSQSNLETQGESNQGQGHFESQEDESDQIISANYLLHFSSQGDGAPAGQPCFTSLGKNSKGNGEPVFRLVKKISEASGQPEFHLVKKTSEGPAKPKCQVGFKGKPEFRLVKKSSDGTSKSQCHLVQKGPEIDGTTVLQKGPEIDGAAGLQKGPEKDGAAGLQKGPEIDAETGFRITQRFSPLLQFQLRNEVQKLRRELSYKNNELLKLSRKVGMYESAMNTFFTECQVKSLTKNTRGMFWDTPTIQKSLLLWESCGKEGYVTLLEQGYPLPSVKTLRSRLQGTGKALKDLANSYHLSGTPKQPRASEALNDQSVSEAPNDQSASTAPNDQSVSEALNDQSVSTAPNDQSVSTAPNDQSVSTAPNDPSVSKASRKSSASKSSRKSSASKTPRKPSAPKASRKPSAPKAPRKSSAPKMPKGQSYKKQFGKPKPQRKRKDKTNGIIISSLNDAGSVNPSMQSLDHTETQSATRSIIQSSTPMYIQSVTQPNTQWVTQPNTQPVTQPNIQSATQPNIQPVTQPNIQSVTQPNIQSATQPNAQFSNLQNMQHYSYQNNMQPFSSQSTVQSFPSQNNMQSFPSQNNVQSFSSQPNMQPQFNQPAMMSILRPPDNSPLFIPNQPLLLRTQPDNQNGASYPS